jgi:hypothetical protein
VRSASFCAAASRPGAARAQACSSISGNSIYMEEEIGAQPTPDYGLCLRTCSAMLPASPINTATSTATASPAVPNTIPISTASIIARRIAGRTVLGELFS